MREAPSRCPVDKVHGLHRLGPPRRVGGDTRLFRGAAKGGECAGPTEDGIVAKSSTRPHEDAHEQPHRQGGANRERDKHSGSSAVKFARAAVTRKGAGGRAVAVKQPRPAVVLGSWRSRNARLTLTAGENQAPAALTRGKRQVAFPQSARSVSARQPRSATIPHGPRRLRAGTDPLRAVQ